MLDYHVVARFERPGGAEPLTEPEILELVDALERHGAVVTAAAGGDRLEVDLAVAADTPAEAADRGIAAVRTAPHRVCGWLAIAVSAGPYGDELAAAG